MSIRTCRNCTTEYPDTPNAIRADLCFDCQPKQDVEKVGGVMLWAHKTAPELQLMASVCAAKQFNKARGRNFTGPSIRFASKDPAFTPKELRTTQVQEYTTRSGEKRRVTR